MTAIGWAVVVALAFLVEGALGFGATVVAMSLGAWFIPVKLLLPALLPFNLVLSLVLVASGVRAIDRTLLLRRIAPLMLCGAPLGYFGLRYASPDLATRVFGLLVCALAVLALARRRAFPAWLNPVLFLAAGTVHGAFGTGGPLVVAGVADRDKATLRATLSALWLLMNLVLLGAFVVDGRFDQDVIALLFPAAVGALVGGLCGAKLHAALDAARFSRVVWLALGATGVLLALR